MDEIYKNGLCYNGVDFTHEDLPVGEYEGCSFTNCNFSEFQLSDFQFVDCAFTGCNLSMAKLEQTALRDVVYKDCKMLGVRFDACLDFGLALSFEGCQLNHSSFFRLKIPKTVFQECQLKDVDFAECDLRGAVFAKCDLERGNFENTQLEKADFRTAINYALDPEKNRLRRAKFSSWGLAGLLDKYDLDIED